MEKDPVDALQHDDTRGVVDDGRRDNGTTGLKSKTEQIGPTDEGPGITPDSVTEQTAQAREAVKSPVTPGGLNEYNSAVNYISELIDQLRDVPQGDAAESAGEHHIDLELASRATQLLFGSDPAEASPPETLLLDETDASDSTSATAGLREDSAVVEAAEENDEEDDYASESGRAFGRSMLHNLREAAHLATSTSLELNDCATHAHRAYCAGFFGCASATFSVIFVLMSPRVGTFGFVAAVAAFCVALALGLAFLFSYRVFLNKAAVVLRARIAAADREIPIIQA